MDSLEGNKVAAAVLLAGMAFVGAGLLGNVLVRVKPLHEAAIKVDLPHPDAGAAPGGPEVPITTLLASADPARGEAAVKGLGCVACHSFNEGGKNGVGPNLYGVVGAPHGHRQDYQYSAVLKGKQGPWDFQALNDWLLKPSAYAPGTKMAFAGISDAKKRADVIDYLRTLAKDPMPLPAGASAAAEGEKPAEAATTVPGQVVPGPAAK